MALEIKQVPKLVQRPVLTPQLQQAIRLLQLMRQELVDLISQEIKDNPLLEEVMEEKEIAEAEESLAGQGKEEPRAETEQTPEVKGEGEGADDYDWESYLGNYNLGLVCGQASQDGEERPSFENFVTKRTTLFDHLFWQLQLSHFTEEEHEVGTYIIGNLDEDGYLKVSLDDVSA